MSLVDLNSVTWTFELPNLFEGGLGLTPFTRGHRTTYLPEKVEVKLVLIRKSAQYTRVMWVHTWVRIRIAIGAILLLTSASGQTVAKRVRSPSQPKIGAVKRLLDVARKMPGAIDEAIEGTNSKFVIRYSKILKIVKVAIFHIKSNFDFKLVLTV